MLILSFASVPLYRAFCAATGFGGTPQKSQTLAKMTPGARVLTVRFDANVSKDLQWRFEPEISKISLRTGETTTVYPNSLINMRNQVIDTVGQVSNILPRWMLSRQVNVRQLHKRLSRSLALPIINPRFCL